MRVAACHENLGMILQTVEIADILYPALDRSATGTGEEPRADGFMAENGRGGVVLIRAASRGRPQTAHSGPRSKLRMHAL
jgi:hypothetical protein